MSSLGQTLRKAREAKGLTPSKVAAETRILVQIVEDIENEDFHRIAAPIYGRGFVRLFAECVGLDPQPLIREFMDIYEGRRAPTVQVRNVPVATPQPPLRPPPVQQEEPPFAVPPFTPEPEPPPVAEPPPAAEPPPVVRGLDLFEQPAASAPAASAPAAPVRRPAGPPLPASETSPFLPPSYEDVSGVRAAERFRSSLSAVSHGVLQSMRDIPRSAWRKALLAACALVVLALVVFGCRALYRMTASPAPGIPVQAAAAAAPAPRPASKAAPAKGGRADAGKKAPVTLRATGPKIPPLYID